MTLHPQCCYCCGSAELLEAATERWHNEADARANQQIRAEKAEARADKAEAELKQWQDSFDASLAPITTADRDKEKQTRRTCQTCGTSYVGTGASDEGCPRFPHRDKAEQPFDPDLMKNYPGPSDRDKAKREEHPGDAFCQSWVDGHDCKVHGPRPAPYPADRTSAK
jgi:hypothetical protein